MTDTPRFYEPERLTEEEFERLKTFIHERLGIKLSPQKKSMLEARLRRRLRHHQMANYREYCDFLFGTGGEEELVAFFDVVTTNKTDFFREPEHFTYLVQSVLPKLGNSGIGTRRPLRVWSCACSSGEEPYTLAMVLSDYAEKVEGFEFEILASDISTEVLQQAESGIYKMAKIEPVPEYMRKKYLLRAKDPTLDLVRVSPELRKKVKFMRINLMDDEFDFSNTFDIIFCRNVLIYFNRETQTEVLQRLCRHLRPDRYLFVGHSENISALPLPVKSEKMAVYRRLP